MIPYNIELQLEYDKSLKTINIEEVKKLFKIIKSENACISITYPNRWSNVFNIPSK